MNSSQVLQEKRYGSFLQTSFIGLNATKEGQDAGYLRPPVLRNFLYS